MRNLEKVGIYQAYMTILTETVVTISHFVYLYEHSILPYQSPKTIGLRRITSKDIPIALALTNQYSLQFEISQIFQSEEEFSHWFLCPSLPEYVTTYVVEDPVTGDITGMFSFRVAVSRRKHFFAQVIAVIVTESPAKQLITDMLIIVKQQQFEFNRVTISSDIAKRLQLDDVFLETVMTYRLLYNYQYGEVDAENFCVFGYFQ